MTRLLLLLIFCPCCNAATIGSVSDSLFDITNVFAKFMWAACILIGIALIVGSLVQYREHRMKPKLVPLTTPVVYLLLGLVVLGIPFINKIFKIEDAYETVRPQEKQSIYDSDVFHPERKHKKK